MKTGIYKIQSIIKPERCYIGSAINIYGRWSKHLSDLGKNIHHSNFLQNHYNKYGLSDLEFSIIIIVDKQDLINVEQYWIDILKPKFNINKIANSSLGIKRSDKTKKLHSEQMKGNKHALNNKSALGRRNTLEQTNIKSKSMKGNKNALGYHFTQDQKNHQSIAAQKVWNERKSILVLTKPIKL